MKERNYYEILDLPLDPPERDVNKALARLAQCAEEWQGASNDDFLKKLLSLRREDMETELSSPSTLKRMGDEARENEVNRVKRFLKNAAVDGQIPQSILLNICNNVRLEADTITRLADELGIVIVNHPINKSCDPMKIPTMEEAAEEFSCINKIKSSVIKNLIKYLEAVSCSDIYEYLGCSKSLSAEELQKKNKQKKNDLPDKGRQNSPRNNVNKSITSQGESYFKSEESKKQYDYAWKIVGIYRRILEELPNYVEGSPGAISPLYYTKLYEQMCAEGLEAMIAQCLLYRFVLNDSKLPFPWEAQTVECPKCKSENDAKNSRCSKCGELIHVNCPKCGKVIQVSSSKCRCGTSFEKARDAYETLGKWGREDLSLNNVDLDQAESDVQKILHTFPEYGLAKGLLAEIKKAKVARLLDTLDPPGITSVQATGRALEIVWRKTSKQGQGLDCLPDADKTPIKYILCRKNGGIPTDPNDGVSVGARVTSPYTDTQITPGVEYGYAVFATVNQKTLCDRIGGKGLVLPEAGVRASAGDGSIRLSWNTLPPEWTVSIVRKEGETPQSVQDGTRLSIRPTENHYDDTTLTNGLRYGYLIILRYKDYEVKASCSATPQLPPPELKLDQWEYECLGTEIRINWELPDGAEEVRWLLADQMPGEPGSAGDAGQFRTVGETDLDNRVTVIRDENICGKFIIPLVIKGNSALVCKARHGGVRDLRLRREIDRICLQWVWPDDCTEALVVCGKTSFAADADVVHDGRTVECTRNRSEREHELTIPGIKDEDCYCSVFMRIGNGKYTEWSAPRHVYSPSPGGGNKVYCRIVKRGNRWVFEAKGKNGIPAMEVRYARNAGLISLQDGKKALRTEASRQSVISVPIPEEACTPGCRFMPFVLGDFPCSLIFNNKSLSIK